MASPAPALVTLKKQLHAAHQDKMPLASLGIMADARHIAGGTSDHIGGNAIDIPVVRSKAFMLELVHALLDDPRCHYVIYERVFYHRGKAPVAYHGSDPHTSHIHMSIVVSMRSDADSWVGMPSVRKIPPSPAPTKNPPYAGKLLKMGLHSSVAVRNFQQKLRSRGWNIAVDGDFGQQTHDVVVAFQREKRLDVDGIVGKDTWTAIWAAPVTK